MTGNLGISGYILMVFSYILLALTFPVAICFCVKVVKEYERAVIFRLGRLLPGYVLISSLIQKIKANASQRGIVLVRVGQNHSANVPPKLLQKLFHSLFCPFPSICMPTN